MKKLIILIKFGLLNLCLISYSQNWDLINPDLKYNYSQNNESFITTTIWVDSITSNEDGDTTYYLNRIVKDCDTCERLGGNIAKYAFYNQPQFLQKTMIVTDSNCIFYSPNIFMLHPNANVGFNWIFDSLSNITAIIVSKIEQHIFNLQDSTKTIQLSTGDTIIISKNYGIIRFDSIYDNNRYNLVGINNIIGDSVPDFFDFYNFSVGDIFEFKGNYRIDIAWGPYNYIKKVFIKSKSVYNDSVVYDVHIKYYELEDYIFYGYYDPISEPYINNYDTKWVLVNSANHPTNRFKNELIQYFNILDELEYRCDLPIDYTILKCYLDEDNLYTKSLGSFMDNDFMTIFDTSRCILERHDDIDCDYFDLCEIKYKAGLGMVYYYDQGFEWWRYEEMVVYAKDNDTIGKFTDDKYFSSVQELKSLNNILIYPNPVKDIINVHTQNGQAADEIRIIGLNGMIFKTSTNSNTISIEGLKPSIYIIEILSDRKINRSKIIISK